MSDTSTLWIIAEEISTEPSETGMRDGADIGGGYGKTPTRDTSDPKRKRVPIDAIALKAQMTGLIQVVSDLFSQAEATTGLHLQEVELTVEINAEG